MFFLSVSFFVFFFVRYTEGARDWLGRRDGYVCRHVRGTQLDSEPAPMCLEQQQSDRRSPLLRVAADTTFNAAAAGEALHV